MTSKDSTHPLPFPPPPNLNPIGLRSLQTSTSWGKQNKLRKNSLIISFWKETLRLQSEGPSYESERTGPRESLDGRHRERDPSHCRPSDNCPLSFSCPRPHDPDPSPESRWTNIDVLGRFVRVSSGETHHRTLLVRPGTRSLTHQCREGPVTSSVFPLCRSVRP